MSPSEASRLYVIIVFYLVRCNVFLIARFVKSVDAQELRLQNESETDIKF